MNHLTDALHIPDTQSERDERHLAIQRVGVKDVRYPLTLRVAGGRAVHRGPLVARRGTAGREEGHPHVALRGLAGAPGRADGRAAPGRSAGGHAGGPGGGRWPGRGPLRVLHPQAGASVRVGEPAGSRRRLDRRAARRPHRHLGRGGRAGQEPVPVLEGDLRLRRAQPALAGDDSRRTEGPAFGRRRVARAGALCRGVGVERDLAHAQARR